jgi:hypothetical protein
VAVGPGRRVARRTSEGRSKREIICGLKALPGLRGPYRPERFNGLTGHRRIERFHRTQTDERGYTRADPANQPAEQSCPTGCTNTPITATTPRSAPLASLIQNADAINVLTIGTTMPIKMVSQMRMFFLFRIISRPSTPLISVMMRQGGLEACTLFPRRSVRRGSALGSAPVPPRTSIVR